MSFRSFECNQELFNDTIFFGWRKCHNFIWLADFVTILGVYLSKLDSKILDKNQFI